MDITGLGALSDLAGAVINKIWPDKSEAEKQQLAAAVMLVQGQLAVNTEEAKSPNVFVSGWRPFIGWTCGMACMWNWIGLPMTKAGLLLAGITLSINPADITEMMPILMGMLGLGGLRTYEKVKGAD